MAAIRGWPNRLARHRHHRQDAYTAPYKKPKGSALTAEQKAYNCALSQVRVRIEHCIGWIKSWAIIATRFRCTHGIYTAHPSGPSAASLTPKHCAGRRRVCINSNCDVCEPECLHRAISQDQEYYVIEPPASVPNVSVNRVNTYP
jgi:hypothetical protein